MPAFADAFSSVGSVNRATMARSRVVKADSGTVLSALVFHRKGRPVLEFKKSWGTACKLAKCPGKLFHDFRRTCARDLIRSGVDETVAMRITGHKTRSVFDRYNISDTEDLREAMLSVEKYRKTQKQKVIAMK
jgi:integrase